MDKFKEIIDTYLINYANYEKGKVPFECEYGELIFRKDTNNTLILFGIYIIPEYRKKGLCRNILHYLIDNSAKHFNLLCIESVLSKILYEYLLRFKYKDKNFQLKKQGWFLPLTC